MKRFEHIDATTTRKAVNALAKGKAHIIAGGTDLMGILKDEVLPEYPETLVNIKTIPGMDYIKEEKGMLKIGALALLDDISRNATVREKYTALAQAASRVASPQVRETGTIGGNICQMPRCWYFRLADNRFFCLRKGGRDCPALTGESRYHSIFGGVKVGSAPGVCIAVNVSDIAPALIALDAKIKTTKRVIEAEKFFAVNGYRTNVLDTDEIVTEIQVPAPAAGTRSAFVKFALRKSIDFPIVNCAAVINGKAARICLNAVFNLPYRATAAEAAITGKTINEANAEAAGEAAMSGAKPLATNKYKVQIAKVMVKRAILACK